MTHPYGREFPIDLGTRKGSPCRLVPVAGFPMLRGFCKGWDSNWSPAWDVTLDAKRHGIEDAVTVPSAHPFLKLREKHGAPGKIAG